ncbi:NLP/P60-like protein [Thermacetogenium phaeum DSM 12270]|uniref:NLP/P60-like protein n=1 Tax=Thermacetogenium phaeum (strain ATCC BAA-254 / DSM 26808 / PB) TaxID=1089553 RepID=K4LJ26_THEPS|nr:SH3 domain-containing protein [Thermacetogenium phaeum]AFV12067.1 NLP/P60-like protein [Thermacetogenium phaeum DSM 12270]
MKEGFSLCGHHRGIASGRSRSKSPLPAGEVLTPEFWIRKLPDPDGIILSEGEIAAYNLEVRRRLSGIVLDLASYPEEMAGEELKRLLEERKQPDRELYLGGRRLGAFFWEELSREMNLQGIREVNRVHYACTVRPTGIRAFPAAAMITERPEEREFDLFQETALDPAEPVIVLHESAGGEWFFVQASFSRGWVAAADLAVARSREAWLDYLESKSFLVVTGSRLRLGYNPCSPEVSELEFLMGSRIPLAAPEEIPEAVDNHSPAGNYVVKLPVRGKNGELAFKLALVPRVADVSEGYLSYTRAGIIRQAFKMLGERYSWGGRFNLRDCSAFVRDVYRSFGFQFPRNSREQELVPGKGVFFANAGEGERKRLLDRLLPGATLHMPGHVMLYLGRHRDEYYVIHAIAYYGDREKRNPDGTLAAVPVNEIAVTTLSLPRRASGQQLLAALTLGKQIER